MLPSMRKMCCDTTINKTGFCVYQFKNLFQNLFKKLFHLISDHSNMNQNVKVKGLLRHLTASRLKYGMTMYSVHKLQSIMKRTPISGFGTSNTGIVQFKFGFGIRSPASFQDCTAHQQPGTGSTEHSTGQTRSRIQCLRATFGVQASQCQGRQTLTLGSPIYASNPNR